MKKEFYLSQFSTGICGWTRRMSAFLCTLLLLGIGISLNAQCLSNVVTCNDNVQISLDGDCSVDLTPDMILEDPCDDSFYTVEFLDGDGNVTGSGSTITSANVGETLTVRVTHNDSGNFCWGTVSVEDKIAPEINCPQGDPVTGLSGELDASDPTYNRIFFNLANDPTTCQLTGIGTDVYYETFDFTVTADGMYTFAMMFGGDGNAALYAGSFDPANPCDNVIAYDDDDNGGFDPLVISALMQVGNYTLVTSSYSNGETGTYDWTFSGPGDVLAGGETPFLCVDIDAVLDGSVSGPMPTATDGCGEPELTYEDVLTDNDCDGAIITRLWTATDGSGNTAQCVQTIGFRQLTIADIDLPANITVECGSIAEPTPEELNSYPTVTSASGTYDLNQFQCNVGATFTDSAPVDICTGSYKIARTWSIFDWCTNEYSSHTQLIKVEDSQPPVFTSCPDDFTVALHPQDQNCLGEVVLSGAEALDVCSGTITTVTASTPNGEFEVGPNGVSIGSLGEGTYTITYTATDDCGNTETCEFDITLEDQSAPVAICDEHTVVALGDDGTAEICAGTFDDGSYDNCQDIVIKVKRMDASASTPFTDCVEFGCADVGNTVMIRMRVYDLLPDGTFADDVDAGRWNECMIEVQTQDKLDPIVTCPPDLTLDCGDDPYDLELTGEATATDNCEVTLTFTTSGSLDNCGEGTIFRRWTATDAGGLTATCRQRIRIINSTPFDEDDIDWPNDATLNCAAGSSTDPESLPSGRDFPVITEDACDLVAITYDDTILPISDTACYKILRVWTVVDWCQFNINNAGDITAGHWQHTQVIKIQDSVEPVINSTCDDITVCSYADDCSGADVELILNAEDACALELNYDYQIDADSDGTIDATGSTNDASGNYPLGTHTIYWSVEDGCGNISECEYRFKVIDCKKPTPICINGLATVVMPTTGEIELWASDFDAPGTSGSFDNCTAQEDLRLRIRKVTPNQNTLTSVTQVLNLPTNVVFTCADLGFPNVELYVVDDAGNWDYCTTYAVIQDNGNICPSGEYAAISGHVETEFQEMVEQVNINVTGTNVIPAFLTGPDGAFQFAEVPMSGNYTVSPEKDVEYLNGVTTYDLVLVSKHILGIGELDSPYKIIAADANRSGSVTTLDMVQIRRLILNIDTELSNNTSWRFVDQDFVFPNAANPFQTTFPEVISFNDLSVNQIAADFVGVKVGDVNGSAVPNNILGVSERNFDGRKVFDVTDVKMEAGQQYTVAFKANQFEKMLGYQFTLSVDTEVAQFVDVEAGSLKQLNADNFGLSRIAEGVITTSWDNANIVSMKDGETVFTVTIEAVKSATLSEVLTLNSTYTAAEAYTADASEYDLAIAFNSDKGTTIAGGTFELFQNEPNPFAATTNVSFNLPSASAVQLTVFDVSGKAIKVVNGEFAKGYNTINLDRSELGAAGMLYYQLDTNTGSATKKMILID